MAPETSGSKLAAGRVLAKSMTKRSGSLRTNILASADAEVSNTTRVWSGAS